MLAHLKTLVLKTFGSKNCDGHHIGHHVHLHISHHVDHLVHLVLGRLPGPTGLPDQTHGL